MLKSKSKSKIKKALFFLGMATSIGIITYAVTELQPKMVSKMNEDKVDDVVDTSILEVDSGDGHSSYILSPSWDTLQGNNVKAWVYIPGTTVNYPIVQGTDNWYYLSRTMYDGYSELGSIFIDSNISNPFHEYNTVVYGHSTYGTGMFSDLKLFENKSYFDSHEYMYILTPEGNYKCEITAFFLTTSSSYAYQRPVYAEQFTNYASRVLAEATYSRGVLTESDKVVTLSTCNIKYGLSSENRILLQGKLTSYDGNVIVE